MRPNPSYSLILYHTTKQCAIVELDTHITILLNKQSYIDNAELTWEIKQFLTNFITVKVDRKSSHSINPMIISFYNIVVADNTNLLIVPICEAYIDCQLGW